MKTPLKTLIAQFIDSMNGSQHDARRLYNIGVRGAKEFNMDITGNYKTVLLDIAANKTAQMPRDCITYSKLGVVSDAGDVILLRNNEDIASAHQLYLSEKITPNVQSFGSYYPNIYPYIWLNYYSGGAMYHLYGLRGGTGTIGEYNIDNNSGTISFGNTWNYSGVLLEYLSDGFDECENDHLIDERASEAFICYIRWKNAQDNRKKFSNNDVVYYKREYYREKRLARMRINPTNVSDMQNIFRSSITLAAKA